MPGIEKKTFFHLGDLAARGPEKNSTQRESFGPADGKRFLGRAVDPREKQVPLIGEKFGVGGGKNYFLIARKQKPGGSEGKHIQAAKL